METDLVVTIELFCNVCGGNIAYVKPWGELSNNLAIIPCQHCLDTAHKHKLEKERKSD